MTGLEARCTECGETFNPIDEDDLVHIERLDGEECGGQGELVGEFGETARTRKS